MTDLEGIKSKGKKERMEHLVQLVENNLDSISPSILVTIIPKIKSKKEGKIKRRRSNDAGKNVDLINILQE